MKKTAVLAFLLGIVVITFRCGSDRSPAPPAGPALPGRPGESAPVGSLVPEWVQPGVRLTYYVMTGSLAGSVNGWVLDEEGKWRDRFGNAYSQDRRGGGSHGLFQSTVAGMDTENVALSTYFYLFNGDDLTPVFNKTLDSLVTADTGGDYWMHPLKQARVLQENPWSGSWQEGRVLARTTAWRDGHQSWAATMVVILGEISRTLYIYDQESGRLLYLSRLTRQAPDIRDPSMTLQDSVSYATFMKFVAVRRIETPWRNHPLAAAPAAAEALDFRGETHLEFQGSTPTPLAISQSLQVERRGGDWILYRGLAGSQGISIPGEFKSVTGPGCLPPIGISPAVLAGLAPGLVIDQDPQTGFAFRVAGMDASSVTFRSDGPRQSLFYVFERSEGFIVKSAMREATIPNMANVRELQLVGRR